MNLRNLNHRVMNQFTAAVAAIMMLASGCLSAAVMILGHVPHFGNTVVSALSKIEVGQLVGTTDYKTSKSVHSNAVFEAVSQTLHLPFSDPLTMVANQLPETDEQVAVQQASGQNSLVAPISSWENASKKIALGWMMSNSTAGCIQMLQQSPGINVAAPTWFHLGDDSGNIIGNVLPNVVRYAHQHNIKVWAVMDNQVNGQWSPRTAHEVLQNPRARMNMIDELAYQCKLYHLGGINVDFEGIYAADRDAFTEFIKEMHEKFSAENLNVSVDIAPDIIPLSDDKAFFHAGLAEYADEVVLMAYDEHWSNDPDPGPVADMPWVTESVNDLLNTGVPTNKLVLAMPFYTRFWYVHKDGHVADAGAYTLARTSAILNGHNATGTWNNERQLMYARYPKPDGYMEVWYPTKHTFADELSIVNDDGLVGIGVWALNFSSKETWSSFVSSFADKG